MSKIRITPRHIWLAISATLALDFYELLVTIPHLAALSGGLPIFDMRPAGYGETEVRALLCALGTSGRRYYAIWHIPADCVLAIAETAAIASIVLWFTRADGRYVLPIGGAWRAALLCLPLLTMGLDLAENTLALALLLGGVSGPSPLVAFASATTQCKWTLAAASLVMVASVTSAALIRGLNTRRTKAGQSSS